MKQEVYMMKMKQQLLMAALCILLALLLIGCGSTPAPTAAPSPSPAESVPSATLPDAGLKPDEIEGICYKNVLKVYKEVL